MRSQLIGHERRKDRSFAIWVAWRFRVMQSRDLTKTIAWTESNTQNTLTVSKQSIVILRMPSIRTELINICDIEIQWCWIIMNYHATYGYNVLTKGCNVYHMWMECVSFCAVHITREVKINGPCANFMLFHVSLGLKAGRKRWKAREKINQSTEARSVLYYVPRPEQESDVFGCLWHLAIKNPDCFLENTENKK